MATWADLPERLKQMQQGAATHTSSSGSGDRMSWSAVGKAIEPINQRAGDIAANRLQWGAVKDALANAAGNVNGFHQKQKSAMDAWQSVMPEVRKQGLDELTQQGMAMADTVGGMGAIKVFHGSPHDFTKFSTKNIGTGEGAQAYGHGLYFAENPAVAKEYQPNSWKRSYTYQGKAGHEWQSQFDGAQEYDKAGVWESIQLHVPKDKLLQQLKDEGCSAATIKYASSLPKRLFAPPGGNLYEANLRWPDPAREAADPMGPQHFLDWDKPLSEQPKAIQAIAAKRLDELRAIAGDSFIPKDPSGEWLHKAFGPQGGESAAAEYGQTGASKALLDAGIPGIRYLDGGSRAAGQGTANYVAFDDAITEILKRNGQPVGGLLKREPTKFELAHAEAQRNAALPVEQGGLGLPPNNTAAQRMDALGYNTPFYHGTNRDVAAFDLDMAGKQTGNPNASLGVFGTTDKAEASRYTRDFGKKDGGNVMPLVTNATNPYPMSYLETDRLAMGQFTAPGATPAERYANAKEITKKRKAELQAEGYDGVRAHAGHPTEETVVFDPRNIRSRFAAFDPKKRNSSDLLASLGLLGLLGAGAYPNEQQP